MQQRELARWRRVQCVWLNHWSLIGLLLIGVLAGRVALAGPSGVSEALQACAQERDDSKRLACYDREMAQPATTPDKSFGLSAHQERKLEPPEVRDKLRPQLLSSTVAAVSARGDGRQVIRLANGETWVQGEAWEVFPLGVGDTITIKPGMLGAFYLYAPSGSATRVTRLR
jgi:hypothetical protein